MRWDATTSIPPASGTTGALTAGGQGSVYIEDVPANGDLPRANEKWWLSNIYLPFALVTSSISTNPTQADVMLQLIRAGVPLWTYTTTLAMVTSAVASNALGNGIASGDLTNPFPLQAGETPLQIWMSFSFDQAVSSQVFAYLAQQAQSSPGGFQINTVAGSIRYAAYSLDDPNA